ncbi:zinc ribbon domain-containing protein [Glycomyces salinus]|uniref:zinc ribbon domain-containing protein n=1 Tax=Glycomyces salinus TaxID=980294 RepID=UPI0018EE0D4C|nr:zinc ribbon domain-containing protein [Glycomyces salinus]
MSKVTRIAYSTGLNDSKYRELDEQARRLGRVRSLVWRQFGSVQGVGVTDRQVRDRWMKDGTAASFGVLATPWKETVRDAMSDVASSRRIAKKQVRRAVMRHIDGEKTRKSLLCDLRYDRWVTDRWLSRQMRRHWKRGRNHVHNQIVVRSDQYRIFTLAEGGDVWLAVPGLRRRRMVSIPLSTTVAPVGTLRLILKDGRVEVHYQVDAAGMRSSQRPRGDRHVGVDKGYTEVLTDSDGNRHGVELGILLTRESDRSRIGNARRAKPRALAERAEARGDLGKANRIKANNLGTSKKNRRTNRWRTRVRTVTFEAAHAVADQAAVIVAEDLSRNFTGRKRLGKDMNRRLATWTRGVTAEALEAVSDRRGSAVRLVNAAYTSQVVPGTDILGVRKGDRLHCTECRAVWQADHTAAVNVLHRLGDPDIAVWTPFTRVKQILRERNDCQRSRLPDQDSSIMPKCRCGERIIRTPVNGDN